ncbi:MAG: GTP-binding protein [Anaerolineales bacterium]|nr:GTP-binding protein [Anaerolineales bacterium]
MNKKICLLGDAAVGKTSLVRRFVYNLFDDKYLSTIGVKVSRKTVAVPRADGVIELTMMLWDLAGSEEFDRVRSSYLRGAAGAILVCDLTRPETIDSLRVYADSLSRVNPNAQVVILGANKCDLVDRQALDLAPIERVAADLNASYYLVSAKTGHEVDNLFRHLGRLLVT